VAETDETAFVAAVLDGQPEPPRYFAEMKRLNRDGPPVLGGMAAPVALDTADIAPLAATTWLVDLRPAKDFAAAHIPGSLSIPYSRSFSTWVGSLVPYDVDIVLLAAPDDAGAPPSGITSALRDLTMIGLDRVVGYLHADAALRAWTDSGRTTNGIEQLTVDDLARWNGEPVTVVDVRGASEWREGHLPGAVHIPLGELRTRFKSLPNTSLVLQCQSGARSAIAASLLERLGRRDVRNLVGGYAAWRAGSSGVHRAGN
jgi:hydroxyacylglutathione hydrolase